MPPRKKEPSGPTPVEAFKHEDKRVNIPTADSSELVSPDVAKPTQLRYPRNPDLDPQLVWTGKDAQDGEDLVVDAPPIYIQEKIVPQVIIENLRKVVEKPQLSLFEDFDGLEGYEAVEYYQHEANWSNRMILGDSLQVMASLAEKENLRGKVQMVYIDPPYGIKFGSNWQVRTDKRDVKDSKAEDVSREVEQIKAFRDTWELGVNSYLAYLRDRLVVARELLTETGSVFVQIGDENSHLVRSILDEVFGADSFAGVIVFVTTSSQTSSTIGSIADCILWYARNADQMKYHQLFLPKEPKATGGWGFNYIELPGGTRRPLSRDERKGNAPIPVGRLYTLDNITSQGTTDTGTVNFEYNGRKYHPGSRNHWKTTISGMNKLAAAGRIQESSSQIRYIRFLDDFAVQPLNNLWTDTTQAGFVDEKVYAVQTITKVIERCILMSTDPGDLVLDPTCGSGTTAFVAEQIGRRWITIDTSRVAIALARQRISRPARQRERLCLSRPGSRGTA